MDRENEFAGYTVDELLLKKAKFNRIQKRLFILTGVVTLILTVAFIMKGTTQGYQFIPLTIIIGTVYPLLAFGSIKKKIQEEIDRR